MMYAGTMKRIFMDLHGHGPSTTNFSKCFQWLFMQYCFNNCSFRMGISQLTNDDLHQEVSRDLESIEVAYRISFCVVSSNQSNGVSQQRSEPSMFDLR